MRPTHLQCTHAYEPSAILKDQMGAARDSQRSCSQGKDEAGESESTTEMMGMNPQKIPIHSSRTSTTYLTKSPNGDIFSISPSSPKPERNLIRTAPNFPKNPHPFL